MNDVRRACSRLNPDEFRLLMVDGAVTFRIVEDSPERGADVVREWEWHEAGPPAPG